MRAVLAWDPSSSATGWALMPLSGELSVIESGRIARPKSWHSMHRVRCLQIEVAKLYERLQGRFARVVVEVPGSVQAGRMRSKYATSGVYAAAVGVVLAESWRAAPPGCQVVTVASDHWTELGTGCGVRKSRRLAGLAAVGVYDPSDDRGGDRGDAIHLGAWYAWRHGAEADESCALSLPDRSGRLWACDLEPDGLGTLRPRGSTFKP